MLRRLIRIELQKALGKNVWLIAVLVVGCALSVAAAYSEFEMCGPTISLALEQWNNKNVSYSSMTCFAGWMSARNASDASRTFFMVWPLLASLPYAWSWVREQERGVVAQQSLRSSLRETYLAHLVATFAAGGVALAAPLLLNFALCATFLPAQTPLILDILYIGGISNWSPLSTLYFTCPLAYVAFWTLLCFVIGGLWASLVMALTCLSDEFVSAYIGSYLLIHVVAFAGSQLCQLYLATLPAEEAGNMPGSIFLPLNLLNLPCIAQGEPDAASLYVAYVLLGALAALLPVLAIRRRDQL